MSDAPPTDVREAPKYWPALVPYRLGESSAYVQTWQRDELNDGFLRTGKRARRAEVAALGFAAANERVYAHDVRLAGYLGMMFIQARYERFYEPLPTGGFDTLGIGQAKFGPNLLGSYAKSVELYPIFGAAAIFGEGKPIPAFTGGLETRIYPVRPLVFQSSAELYAFKDGPAMVDFRLESGVSIGMFDFRAGVRVMHQQPEQSFWGPVASITMRL